MPSLQLAGHRVTGPVDPARLDLHANDGPRGALVRQVAALLVGRHRRILPTTRRSAGPLLARSSVGHLQRGTVRRDVNSGASSGATPRETRAQTPYVHRGPIASTTNPAKMNPIAFAVRPSVVIAPKTRPRIASRVPRCTMLSPATSPTASVPAAKDCPTRTWANTGATETIP